MRQFTASMLCCKRSEAATKFGGSFSRDAALSKGKKDRIVIGLASVFGNIDAMNEIVDENAFNGAILDFFMGKSRARFLWNHDSSQPPIGKILAMKALKRDQLPREMIAADPNITGALQVTKQYFTDAFAERVYQGVVAGAITEMSFAYDVKLSRREEREGKEIRILEQLEIFDIADVNWGANSRTVARVTSPKRAASSRSKRFGSSTRFLSDAKARAMQMAIGTPALDRMLANARFDMLAASAQLAISRPGPR